MGVYAKFMGEWGPERGYNGGYNPGPVLMNQLIGKDNPLRW
jgi:hypothetical protein